ncbi:MAG: DUF4446 family protein [Selenomonas ruminantium]|nr:DUF4446 family protein [Selenomonas ruminantium]
MDIQVISQFVLNNLMFIVAGMGILMVIMYAFILNLYMDLRRMKKRYKKMMTGVESGNLERMLIGHIDEVQRVKEQNTALEVENQKISDLLQQALTRVGMVRFRAFEDMGGDLSYAVAMLDSHNNGVILSSVFGREGSQAYAKPIENGSSTYKLTEEEQQALREAMANS